MSSSVLDPAELSASPLADLHTIADELGLDGYRRLRKADLIDKILVASGGEPAPRAEAPDTDADSDGDDDGARRGGRSRGRSRSRRASEETVQATAAGDEAEETEASDDDDRPRRRTRGGRTSRSRAGSSSSSTAASSDSSERSERSDRGERTDRSERSERGSASNGGGEREPDKVVEGVVELASNGSGFVRVAGPDASDDDVYLSAAQIKRCELVSGDKVTGPVRPPRRSERYASLVRIDTINGRPADEVSGEGTRFDDLPVVFPAERFELASDDETVKAIEWLTPIGRGSRVSVVGASQSGKTETLLRLTKAVAAIEGVELSVVLAGARPEELSLWEGQGHAPAGSATLGASPEAQAQAIETVIEQARRQAVRGGDAVVVVDSLEQLALPAARRLLASARNLLEGGSLTIIASSALPVGGETTVVALDAGLTALRRFPALDLAASGTLRPELLVGDAGAEAIAKARAEAL